MQIDYNRLAEIEGTASGYILKPSHRYMLSVLVAYLDDFRDTIFINSPDDDTLDATITELLYSILNPNEVSAVNMLIGTVFSFASIDNPPDKSIRCDGQSLLIEEYPELYAVIGYTFGGIDLSFNVPSMNGRVVVAAGGATGSTSNRAIGSKSGVEEVTLSIVQIPAHRHVLSPYAIGSGDKYVANSGNYVAQGNDVPFTDIQSFPTGGNQPHSNMQPFIALPYYIYAGR